VAQDPTDPAVFHKISLVAFLAWVGLGADGLSSSSYGPDEAFRALLATSTSPCSSRRSPPSPSSSSRTRTGSWSSTSERRRRVRRRQQAPRPDPGVVSGSALVVDYLLTITISICSGMDALLSFLPLAWHSYKVPLDIAVLAALLVLNLRA